MADVSRGRARRVVVGLGEILWDLLPAGRQLGGAPANFAYHAHLLGAEAYVASCVGDDPLGREICSRIDALGLDRRFIQVCGTHPTGTVEVNLDAAGNPQYVIRGNVAWDFIEFTPELLQLAGRCDAVCFGTLCQRSEVSRRTIHEFLNATRPDCLRVLDINLRQSYFSREIIDQSLVAANVLKMNDQELPVVAKMLGITGSDPEVIAKLIDHYSLQMVAVTKAEEGSILCGVDRVSRHPGFKVEVAYTVGAGDAFTAALVTGMMMNFDLEKLNAAANRIASHVCTRAGATPEIPAELANELFRE